MEKKRIILGVLFLVGGFVILVLVLNIIKINKAETFLNSLKGEIIYVNRDGQYSNVYKISANGKNRQMLYHNIDRTNSNCLFPQWSSDGSRIFFTAMRNGQWRTFIMDSDGSNVEVVENKESSLVSHYSRANDIIVKAGNVYCVDDKGNEFKVYSFDGYDYKFNPGASEASWSPDKKFVIFQSCEYGFLGMWGGCSILIADPGTAEVVKITAGKAPDWKY
ncbi:MAG: hypothetical protein MUF05_04615 [Candidatus Omnitrophica bacterium]|jgi:Tol biopolymer transport system component|nr:hypothetical protein [Candidatus Omnitrophota bacterium]